MLQAQSQNSQYSVAQTFATQTISTETTVLTSVVNAIRSAHDAIISAGNGSLNDDDRSSYATQLEGIRASLLNLANSTDGNGNYIFAGYKSDKPPYTADPTTGQVSGYKGGDDPINQQVADSRTMTISHTGTQVFAGSTANAKKEPDGSVNSDLFKTIDDAIAMLKTPSAERTSDEYSAALDKANRGLDNSLNNVSSIQAQQGTQLAELDILKTVGDAQSTTNTNKLSDLVNIDEYHSVYNYTIQQTALQASMKAFSAMQTMSLFQLK